VSALPFNSRSLHTCVFTGGRTLSSHVCLHGLDESVSPAPIVLLLPLSILPPFSSPASFHGCPCWHTLFMESCVSSLMLALRVHERERTQENRSTIPSLLLCCLSSTRPLWEVEQKPQQLRQKQTLTYTHSLSHSLLRTHTHTVSSLALALFCSPSLGGRAEASAHTNTYIHTLSFSHTNNHTHTHTHIHCLFSCIGSLSPFLGGRAEAASTEALSSSFSFSLLIEIVKVTGEGRGPFPIWGGPISRLLKIIGPFGRM